MSTISSTTVLDVTTADDGTGTYIADVSLPGTSNDLLLVYLIGHNTGPASIAIDGNALTYVTKQSDAGYGYAVHLWQRAVVSNATTLQLNTGTVSRRYTVIAHLIDAVDTANPIAETAQSYVDLAAGQTITTSLASATAGDLVVDGVAANDSGQTLTAGSGQNVLVSDAAGFKRSYSSEKTASVAAEALSWTSDTGGGVAQIVTLLAPSAADTTAPTLSNPTLTVDSNTAVTFGATSNEDGTGHAVVRLASDPQASGPEIVNGTYANAVAVPADVDPITANTAYQFAQVTGLTGNTTYAVDQVATDAAGNISAVSTQTFTTQSKALRLTLQGGASKTLNVVLFDAATEDTNAILKTLPNQVVAADGSITLDLNDTSITDGSAVEGLGKDVANGDPYPLQGTVTVQ